MYKMYAGLTGDVSERTPAPKELYWGYDGFDFVVLSEISSASPVK
jgi:hypothetical protein